jgi:hypothetical protein
MRLVGLRGAKQIFFRGFNGITLFTRRQNIHGARVWRAAQHMYVQAHDAAHSTNLDDFNHIIRAFYSFLNRSSGVTSAVSHSP